MGSLVLRTIGLARTRFQLALRCVVYNMRRVTQLEVAGVRAVLAGFGGFVCPEVGQTGRKSEKMA